MNKFIFILALLLNLPAFGAGSAPRTDAAEARISAAEVALMPNLIINGGFDFWQRGTTSSNITSGGTTYLADRFFVSIARATGAVGVSQVCPSGCTFVRTNPNYASSKSALVTPTTAEASLDAGDYLMYSTRVEGTNMRPLIGKTATLSFWVRSNVVGTYVVAIKNSANNSAYIAPYTIDQSGTWEKKIITFTVPTSVTWDDSSAGYMQLIWTLWSGSSLNAPSTNTWLSGGYIGHSSMVQNFMASTSNEWLITQVMLNEGSQAAPFKLAGGTIGGELHLAQRYFQTISNSTSNYLCFGTTTATDTSVNLLCPLAATMRTSTPTLTISGTVQVACPGTTKSISSPSSTASNTVSVAQWTATIGAGCTTFHPVTVLFSSTATAWFDAEL